MKKNVDESFAGQSWFKIAFSIFIVIHFAAVISAPFSLVSQGQTLAYRDGRIARSPIADSLFMSLEPYTTFFFLNHGYSFFAPEPGPSHLVHFQAEVDGKTIEGVFPDLKEQWPRLLYHRHFMLSETLNARFRPEGAEDDVLKAQRQSYLHLRKSIENHLAKKHSASKVTVTRILHDVPPLDVFRQGQRLDDPTLLRKLSEKDNSVTNLPPTPGGPQ